MIYLNEFFYLKYIHIDEWANTKINEWDKLNQVRDMVVDRQIFCLYNWILHGNPFLNSFLENKIIIMDAELLLYLMYPILNWKKKQTSTQKYLVDILNAYYWSIHSPIIYMEWDK